MSDERPITVDELKPFFAPEGLLHVELAVTRFHLAVARQRIEALEQPDD